MITFTLPGLKAFLIMGIAEIALGVFLVTGVLRSRSGTIARIIGGAVLIAFGVWFLTMRNTGEIKIEEGRMHLKVPFNRDKVIDSGDIVTVREVNIYTDEGVRPVRKVSGGKVGDVRTGWFRLANGEKAFLALHGPRALYIETTLGFPALVGVMEFEEFEAAFIEHVHAEGDLP